MALQQLAIGLAQRYGDVSALKMIQQVLAGGGQPLPSVGGISPAEVANPSKGEAKHVERARAQARNSTEAT